MFRTILTTTATLLALTMPALADDAMTATPAPHATAGHMMSHGSSHMMTHPTPKPTHGAMTHGAMTHGAMAHPSPDAMQHDGGAMAHPSPAAT